jgi:glycosyltransferase involved in cell wall biosynthesis
MLLRIGILFKYDENWIGGTYYLVNLISALNLLSDSDKPRILIFSNSSDFKFLISQVNYPILEHVEIPKSRSNLIIKIFNRFTSNVLGKKTIQHLYRGELDAIFPFRNIHFLQNIPLEKRIYWIPDFQEKHFPEFYSQEHLDRELATNTPIVMESKKLVLSSYNALNDLRKFYPDYKSKPFVVHFATKYPTIKNIDKSHLLSKYNLPEIYFFAPNQFWKHKNHIVVIKAIEELKLRNIETVVVFSGKEYDSRNPDYSQLLKTYVKSMNLNAEVRFLGFIDRNDQLQLMKHSMAVIQPSLFEGWSTVIEEAMAFNKVVIASDLDVNKEQLGEQGYYFCRHSFSELANRISEVLTNLPKVVYQYEEKQRRFAEDFLNCIKT